MHNCPPTFVWTKLGVACEKVPSTPSASDARSTRGGWNDELCRRQTEAVVAENVARGRGLIEAGRGSAACPSWAEFGEAWFAELRARELVDVDEYGRDHRETELFDDRS
jgi:hypothetical protein